MTMTKRCGHSNSGRNDGTIRNDVHVVVVVSAQCVKRKKTHVACRKQLTGPIVWCGVYMNCLRKVVHTIRARALTANFMPLISASISSIK